MNSGKYIFTHIAYLIKMTPFLDVIGAVNEQDDHTKNRNYWKYLKTKLKKEQNELVSATTQLIMKGIRP